MIERKRLETRGWKIGSAREFLDLNDQEQAYIDLRLKLADALKRKRISRHLTQEDLARAVSSSQSRVAKMEAGDASVSLDLLVRSLLATGASNSDLAKIIAGSHVRGKAAWSSWSAGRVRVPRDKSRSLDRGTSPMEARLPGKTGLKVSVLSLGCGAGL